MPDGQGQTGSFSLLSAERIEVLRGPFSTLYGNASGGVIAVFTEDPTPDAGRRSSTASVGSYAHVQRRAARRPAPRAASATWSRPIASTPTAIASTPPRRATSSTRSSRSAPARRRASPSSAARSTSPTRRTRSGLTQAQWDADPRQADPVAMLFNTRKTVNQLQGGVAVEHALRADATLRVTGYGGTRQIGQYLALSGRRRRRRPAASSISIATTAASARGSSGAASRSAAPLTLSVGVDADRMREKRQGFVNDFGDQGALRRDEDDTVRSADAYAEAQWHALPALSLTLGVRTQPRRLRVRRSLRHRPPIRTTAARARYYQHEPDCAASSGMPPTASTCTRATGRASRRRRFAETRLPPGGPGPQPRARPGDSTRRASSA